MKMMNIRVRDVNQKKSDWDEAVDEMNQEADSGDELIMHAGSEQSVKPGFHSNAIACVA